MFDPTKQSVIIDGIPQPSFCTIIWRYYFHGCKDASQATKLANEYISESFPNVPQPWF